jgi:disulfide bond formation protein DsbB
VVPLERLREVRPAAGVISLAAAATVGAALVFEHGFGYLPCKLCLQQRWPYYIAAPFALALAFVPLPRALGRIGLGAVALIFLAGAGLGLYHAGVEWGVWPGPNDCGGASAPVAAGMGDFLKQLETTRVVSCTEAAWRLFGLSMAGWNVVASLALALLALLAATGRRGEPSAVREPSR